MIEGFVGYVAITALAAVVYAVYLILESLGEKTKKQAQDTFKKVESTEFYKKKSNEIAEKRKKREERRSQKAKEDLEKFDRDRAQEKLHRKIEQLPEYIDTVKEYFDQIDFKQRFPTKNAALNMVRNLEIHLSEIGKYPDYVNLLADLYRRCEFRIDDKWVQEGFHLWHHNTNIALRQVPESESKSFLNNNPIQLIINPIINLQKNRVLLEAKYMQVEVQERTALDQIYTFKTFSEIKDNKFEEHINDIRIY